MNAKTVYYVGDLLFHAISRDNTRTIMYFIYLIHYKVDSTQFLNVLPCILSKKLLINHNAFITKSWIEKVTLGIWD